MSTEKQLISNLLSDDRVRALLDKQDKIYWESLITASPIDSSQVSGSITKLSFLLSTYVLSNPSQQDLNELVYKLLKTLSVDNANVRAEWNDLMDIPITDESLSYYFFLCSIALQSNKTISARLALAKYQEQNASTDWGQRVLTDVLRATLYLIRKQNGFEDIRRVIHIVENLQKEQTSFEADYLNKYTAHKQTSEALWLVSLYHTSKAVVETAQYILQGYNYPNRRIETIVRPHLDIAKKLAKNDRLETMLNIIEADLNILIKNCIWNGTAFNDKLRKLCEAKSKMGLLELLPSQRDAINQNLFNVAANAIVLQMPTSAGKTLLAEFNIAVTKTLLSDSKIVYVVPSRALVNQVYHDLRTDLASIDLSVEKTSSVNEVDPSEDNFLKADEIDVLVSTPEKLDLLIRRNHPSVQNVSLFIIDEAHMMREGVRGARLELLISILRRERPNAKFMFLSPFLPGDKNSIQEWLGGGNTIEVQWKPSEKIILGLKVNTRTISSEMIESSYAAPYAHEYSLVSDLDIDLSSTANKEKILEYTCKRFAEQGKTQLILCDGRKTANNTALKIFDWLDAPANIAEDTRIVQKYLEEEIGCPTLFSQLLSKGVAVHHAGLSDETRLLTEHLIRERHIQYICSTTTVAEGVNFPVSSVYFDTYKRGGNRGNDISSNDFWNIAGRAGRTMIDDYGKIILPFNTPENKEKGISIVKKSAEELTSVLSQLFYNRASIIEQLNTNEHALNQLTYQYADSFEPLFQYFIHLLHISGSEYVQDVEDLFKDTYLYSRLNPSEQSEFINLCRKIYQTIEAKYSSKTGVLNFADKTGFSVPSVLQIMAEKAHNSNISALDSWRPENLFNAADSSNLAEKIRVIATLRETELGTDSNQSQFNPDLVAKMLISWVHGDKINTISAIHPYFRKEDENQVISDFVNYMNGARFKASWGLSALEGIVKGVESDVKDSYIPSFVYYGVNDPKALALRMIGVPRGLSTSLANALTGEISTYSYKRLRQTINDLSLRDWDTFRPFNSNLSGEEWKRIVSILIKEK